MSHKSFFQLKKKGLEKDVFNQSLGFICKHLINNGIKKNHLPTRPQFLFFRVTISPYLYSVYQEYLEIKNSFKNICTS